MAVETILKDAQTYIGVLATFIVLCLFASKKGTGSNFIIYTILMVGEDFKKHLKTYTDEISKEIEETSAKLPAQSELGNISREIENELNKNSRNIMMITQRFFHNATRISGQFNPDPHFQEKEELPYIALLCLLLIITVMLIDCIGIMPINTRCTFINLLLGASTIFISVLYHKFFQEDAVQNTDDNKRDDKPNRKLILAGFFLLLVIWFLVAPFICSTIVSIGILAAIMLIGIYVIKGKWIRLCHKNNRYNRFMIIKHYVCFMLYIAIMTIIFQSWDNILEWIDCDEKYIANWNNTASAVASLEFCYYFTLTFFSLNTIFGPLLAGFLYINAKENEIISLIESKRKEIQPIIKKYVDDYNQIVAEIPVAKTS